MMLRRDSYWILKGLLVSRMNTTAEDMCFNLLSLLKTYGHVPNGEHRACQHAALSDKAHAMANVPAVSKRNA
jgi:neutral trehalase